jgi:hypothetical protein
MRAMDKVVTAFYRAEKGDKSKFGHYGSGIAFVDRGFRKRHRICSSAGISFSEHNEDCEK